MTSTSEGINTLSVALIIGLICVLAVLSNSVVILLTYCKMSVSKSHTNLYIINLAVSDIILSGITIPLILLDANIPGFSTADVECKLKMALPLCNICSSVYTMMVMSFDRLRVIVNGKVNSTKAARISVAFIWLASLAVTAPQFYEYSLVEKWEEEENETETSCSSAGKDEAFKQSYAVLVLVLAYLMPLVAVTTSYTRVVIFLQNNSSQVRSQVSRAKIRVLWTAITITIVFVLLWLPFFVLFTIEEVTGTDDSSEFSSTPHIVKQVFVALSGVSNPIIYFALIPEYRRACVRLFCNTASGSAVHPADDNDTNTEMTRSHANANANANANNVQSQSRAKP